MNSNQEERLSHFIDTGDSLNKSDSADWDPELAKLEETVRMLQSERLYEPPSADFENRGLERILREAPTPIQIRKPTLLKRRGFLTAAASLLLVVAVAASALFNQQHVNASEIRVTSNVILQDLGVEQVLNPQYAGSDKQVSYGVDNDKIVIWDRSSKNEQVFPLGFSYMRDMTWSPDGKRAAFSGYESAKSAPASPGIWVVNRDGSNAVQISKPADPDTSYQTPVWSPDGKSIAYTAEHATLSDATGVVYQRSIEVVNADGSNRRIVTAGKQPTWSPEGTKLAYALDAVDGQSEIWTINLTNNQKSKIAIGQMPVWSPQDRFIAYSKTRTEHKELKEGSFSADISYDEIWAVNVDNGNETQLTSSQYPQAQLDAMLAESEARGEQQANYTVSGITSDWDADWSADGRHIVFTRDTNDEQGIHFALQELTLDYK